MANVTVGILGTKELVRELNKRLDIVNDGLEDAIHKGAEPIRDMAEDKAPQFTGELSDNIFIETITDEGDLIEVAIGPDDEVFWALFVEFGTRSHNVKRVQAQGLQIGSGIFRASASGVSHPPIPFLRPAFDSEQDNAIEIIGKEIWELISK